MREWHDARRFGMMPRIDSVREPERSKQCGHAQTRHIHTRARTHARARASMHNDDHMLERAARPVSQSLQSSWVLLRRLDVDLCDTLNKSTWYTTIQPRALAERSRTQALFKVTGRQSASIF